MRSLWSIVSFLAVVNLLALMLLIGWLWQSGRLNPERLREVRALLAAPVLDEAEAGGSTAGGGDGVEAEADSPPPLPSAMQVEYTFALQEQAEQATRRMAEAKRLLEAQLERTMTQLQREREQFEQERRSWTDSVREDRERKADEQFAKVVKQLESIPAKQAKAILVELAGQGSMEQAIAYFDAMQPRAAAKVLKEFKTQPENTLATELLERLRTFGLEPMDPEAPGDDDPLPDTT